ncbi:MAG: beta-ketoacyl-ACP synthase [Candidatus Paracaedibacteraceae bacterium]|nr:beta-ketoacyl-ACP synthase [Candidatus Paracaedibacteraceae bacterium]
MTLYLNDLGIACSLGVGKKTVVQNLLSSELNFYAPELRRSHEQLLSGKTVVVQTVPAGLDTPFETKFHEFDSRNNRLLRLGLDEIRDTIEAMITRFGSSRVGIILGTSTSGMLEGQQAFAQYHQTQTWPSGFSYKQQETNSPAEFAAFYLGIDGPAYTLSTACSSSGKALCSAARLINAGICDAVLVGGVDSLCGVTLNGFDGLELTSESLCSPFSADRQGITIGEGAAVFVMSKELSAIRFAGGGESSDAYHISAPSPKGEGAEQAIQDALNQAGLLPEHIHYINLHGTGTLANDEAESHCINRLFGDKTLVSSTKALTGHTLGAAAAIEAAFLWLSLSSEKDGEIMIPPHIWNGKIDESLPKLNFSSKGACLSSQSGCYNLMSNSFAFGGSNVSIIVSKDVRCA